MHRHDDPRLGDLIVTEAEFEKQKIMDMKSAIIRKRVGLIGVPCDIGVARNGGRVGAREGPGVIWKLLPRVGCVYNRELGIDLRNAGIQLVDLQHIDCHGGDTNDLESVHRELRSRVRCSLQAGLLPLCVGGGNDQSWANGAGWLDYLRQQRNQLNAVHMERRPRSAYKQRLAIVNVDAHLDVRPMLPTNPPQAHSGSPFRQLLDFTLSDEELTLVEFAAQGQQCASSHVDYVLAHGGRVIWLSDLDQWPGETRSMHPSSWSDFTNPAVAHLHQVLKQFTEERRHVFFSFDIDAVQAADCPGVSCPSPRGLSAEVALSLCMEAGKWPCVELMDISEFNPCIESDQTARLVVNMIYHFLLGLAKRPSHENM